MSAAYVTLPGLGGHRGMGQPDARVNAGHSPHRDHNQAWIDVVRAWLTELRDQQTHPTASTPAGLGAAATDAMAL
jgi:hypothetical protein